MVSFYSLKRIGISTVALISAGFFLSQKSVAQTIQLTTPGTAYTQDFNTLSSVAGTTNNALSINGWYLAESGTATRNNGMYAVDNGNGTAGDVISFGTAAASDRAFGTLRSGTLIPLIGAAFTNTTGATIASLEISYYGEEWRLGTVSRTDVLNFEYSTNATDLTTGAWTGVTALNFVTPNTFTAGGKDGNLVANRALLTATITGLSISDGATFWIRWVDTDASGADDGLAVDDFTLTPQAATGAPEMDVQGNATSIANGSAFPVTFNHTNFEDQSVCSGVITRTFTILNTGAADLHLTGTPVVNITGSGAADFSITVQPSATITAGGTSSFVVEFNPSSAGNKSAIIDIDNDDADENPYEFYILGTGVETTVASSTQTNVLCNGGANGMISITATGMPALSYNWEPGTPAGEGTATVTALAAGVYTVTVTDVNSCQATETFTITEPVALSVNATASNTLVCAAGNVTLSATANGGAGVYTYTWSTNENTDDIIVNPTSLSTYTIDITDANNCTATNTISIDVNPIPTITVNSGTICAGQSFTISPSGADTYTITGGMDVVSPSADASYTVTGTSVDGCVNSTGVVSDVTVNALPVINVSTTNTLLCTTETATLTASGADTYTWSTTETTDNIAVTPLSTTDYTVDATDANGCMNSTIFTQSVSICTGIESHVLSAFSVYPNPSHGQFTIDVQTKANIEVYDLIGNCILRDQLQEGKHNIALTNQANGVYLLKTTVNGKESYTKLIKH